MKITKESITLENGIEKEWLITNGLGGFASSTIIGANTRRYHGLLIAPLTPPARRHLIISKIDESIDVEGKRYDLFTNICENYITHGYKNLDSFEYEYIPTFNYKVEDINIKKNIVMEYGKNTVAVQYKIKNGKNSAKLNLAPILNFRDFHGMNLNHEFELRQDVHQTKIKLILDKMIQFPVYIKFSEGNYIAHERDIFRDMFYIEEEKRGFESKENHIVSGVCEIELKPKEEKEITVVCSFEENIDEINVQNLIDNEIKRLDSIVKNTGLIKSKREEFKKQLIIASDKFIANRPSFGLHTIIAGYPWFLDWGRDSLIAFEGILLKTKRFDIAKEVLLTMIRDIKYGLVPNGYSGFDNRPLYNSVDSSLLLFEQVKKYIEYTGDYDFIENNIYPKLELVIENYVNGIDIDDNNIYLDEDNLIVAGTENTQNTWMDAKYDDFAVTPRNGKAVEINSLWYNSLMIMAELTSKFQTPGKARKYKQMAKKTKETFNEKFYNKRRKCLFDVLGDNRIRPNQLFSLSLTYPVVDPSSEEAYNIIKTVESKLLNNYGLKTLAKGEPNYVETYEGDAYKRDTSYHQGITWTWLLGLYYNALNNMMKAEKSAKKKKELEEKISKFREKTKRTFKKELFENGCIGNIAEIYDSCKPQKPKGAIAQAWSLGEILRICNGGRFSAVNFYNRGRFSIVNFYSREPSPNENFCNREPSPVAKKKGTLEVRILGIDPGFAITGYSIIDFIGNKFRLVTSGAILTEAKTSFPLRLEKIYTELDNIIKTFNPECMSIEELFFNNNAKTAINVAQARGVILMTARIHGIDIYEYTPLQVKQAVVGYGRADKIQVQRMVKIILNTEKLPKLDDITDSMAIGICHAHSAKFAEKL